MRGLELAIPSIANRPRDGVHGAVRAMLRWASRDVRSRGSARNKAQIDASRVIENGSVVAMAAVCSAFSPLASSNAKASTPMLTN